MQSAFAHRQNRDESWDLICSRCYMTIATAMIEADLVVAESAHECKGYTQLPFKPLGENWNEDDGE